MNDMYEEAISSSIHKLNYAYKVLSIFLVFICIVLTDSNMDLFMVNFFIFIIMLLTDIKLRVYLRNISMFSVFLFLIFFCVSLVNLSLYEGFFFTVKVIDLILYISIIAISSTYYHLAIGVRNFLFPFRYFINIDKVSLNLAYSIKFVDCLYDEYDRVHRVSEFRGVNFKKMGVIDKLTNFFNELGILVRFAIFSLNKQRDNVLVKKYGVDSFRYNYRLNKWGKTDTILLVINFIVIFITFVY